MKLSPWMIEAGIYILLAVVFLGVWAYWGIYLAIYAIVNIIGTAYLVFKFDHLWSILKQFNVRLLGETTGIAGLLLIGSHLLENIEWANRRLFTLPVGDSILEMYILRLQEVSPWHAVAFYIVFLVLIPILAYCEEEIFRGSAFSHISIERVTHSEWLPIEFQSWVNRFFNMLKEGKIVLAIQLGWLSQGLIVRNLVFAIIHLLNGIPVGTVLMQLIVGFWLCFHYTIGGVNRSTAYHAYVNYLLVIWYVFIA
ncbi:MAG: hypothetical protein ACOCXQ_02760 [Patescibacteria group bacterium]